MSKKVLKIDYSDSFGFILIGISSGLKDYRLCHELNQKLELDFERKEDHKLLLGKNNLAALFSKFSYVTEDEHAYTLLVNKSNEQFLIPELKNIDYFLIVDPSFGIEQSDLISAIKSVEKVAAVFPLSANDLKSKHNLLF